VRRPPFVGTWIAVGVLAALGAYIYLVELERPDVEEKAKQKVFTFDKTKVESVGLSVPGQEDVRLARAGDRWQMTAPMAVTADAGQADALVSSLEGLEMDGVVAESPSDPAEYGLAAPRATVSLRLQGAPAPLELQVGDKTPDGNAVYARAPPASRVFTIPAYASGSFTKKPFELRDRNVLHIERDAVRTLDITGPGGAYALAKDEKGEWAIVRPLRTRAGRWSVDALVGVLEGLAMEAVAAENATDLRSFGLAPPQRTVAVGLADGSSRTLEIGSSAPEGRHHARLAGSPLVAIVPGAVAADLAKGMGELRAKRLLEVSTLDVEGLDVESGAVKRVHARASSKDEQGTEVHKWKRTAPDAKDLDTNKVQDALFAVGGLDVLEFVDAPAPLITYGLDVPALRVTMRHAGGRAPVWFEVGTKDGAYYGRREGDAAVMKLDPVKAAELIDAFTGM